MHLRLVTLAVTAVGAFTLPASGHAQFAGKWAMTFGSWKTDDGATVEIRSASSGVLEVTVKGDSASAVWTPEGQNPRQAMRGKISAGKLLIQASREGRVSVDGQESTVMITIEFELKAVAGTLTGVMRLQRPRGGTVSRSATGKPAS